MQARFIVLEGIDGAGTTTQAARLTAALVERGLSASATREPSDGVVGKLLRQMLGHQLPVRAQGEEARAAQLALLFAADRLDHVGAEIAPALARGEWVVSDRYDHSSVAYQSVSSHGALAIDWLRALNRYAVRPTLTIVLDVDAEVAKARRLARDDSRELFDDDELQRRLALFYREIERHFPDDRVVHVDANRSVDEVFAELLALTLG